MKGIIKSNTENKSNQDIAKMEETPLKSTPKEGQEMIWQFVEQGIIDDRCELIAIIAPQNFDNGLKGTLRHLAKLANKKVVFIGLGELEKVYSLHRKRFNEKLKDDTTST